MYVCVTKYKTQIRPATHGTLHLHQHGAFVRTHAVRVYRIINSDISPRVKKNNKNTHTHQASATSMTRTHDYCTWATCLPP